MKHDVCMCNISMEGKICRLHCGIKNTRLHILINYNINLNDPWLRTLELDSFKTFWKLSDSKSFNNYMYLCNNSINIRI